GFFVWKLLPAVRDVSLLWPNPLKALMVVGGAADVLVGLLAGSAYTINASLRRGVTLRELAHAAAYGGAVFLVVHAVSGGWSYGAPTGLPWGIALSDPSLRYHPLNVYEALTGLGAVAVLLISRMRMGEGRAGSVGLPLLGMGLVAVSLFGRAGAVP